MLEKKIVQQKPEEKNAFSHIYMNIIDFLLIVYAFEFNIVHLKSKTAGRNL